MWVQNIYDQYTDMWVQNVFYVESFKLWESSELKESKQRFNLVS